VSAKSSPMWPGLEAIAHTLAYDAVCLGNGEPPTARFAKITQPTLVATGGAHPPGAASWFLALDQAVDVMAASIPQAEHQTLKGQSHVVDRRRSLRCSNGSWENDFAVHSIKELSERILQDLARVGHPCRTRGRRGWQAGSSSSYWTEPRETPTKLSGSTHPTSATKSDRACERVTGDSRGTQRREIATVPQSHERRRLRGDADDARCGRRAVARHWRTVGPALRDKEHWLGLPLHYLFAPILLSGVS
jgi:hypothetical protein